MERRIAVYIEAKDEKMVSQTHLPLVWAKPPSMTLSKHPIEVKDLSSMESIPIFPPPYVLHYFSLDE